MIGMVHLAKLAREIAPDIPVPRASTAAKPGRGSASRTATATSSIRDATSDLPNRFQACGCSTPAWGFSTMSFSTGWRSLKPKATRRRRPHWTESAGLRQSRPIRTARPPCIWAIPPVSSKRATPPGKSWTGLKNTEKNRNIAKIPLVFHHFHIMMKIKSLSAFNQS